MLSCVCGSTPKFPSGNNRQSSASLRQPRLTLLLTAKCPQLGNKLTYLRPRLKAARDPSCVQTRTGPIPTNYLYNFNANSREISGLGSLARYKISPASNVSAFLHNQDPFRTCRSINLCQGSDKRCPPSMVSASFIMNARQ